VNKFLCERGKPLAGLVDLTCSQAIHSGFSVNKLGTRFCGQKAENC